MALQEDYIYIVRAPQWAFIDPEKVARRDVPKALRLRAPNVAISLLSKEPNLLAYWSLTIVNVESKDFHHYIPMPSYNVDKLPVLQ